MRITNCFRFLLTLTLFTFFTAGLAQVDEPRTAQDTLFIYEEEVVYDTLYLYDSIPQLELKSKDELLEAFRRNRVVGRLYYQRGHMYITGTDGELFRLVAASRAFADPLAVAGPTSYIVPSDPKIYDVDAHFEREKRIMWHQPKSAKVGDVVYLYYGAPVSAVRCS